MIALGVLGTLCVGAGPAVAVLTNGLVGALVGSGSVLLGGKIWWQLAHSARTAQVAESSQGGDDTTSSGRRAA